MKATADVGEREYEEKQNGDYIDCQEDGDGQISLIGLLWWRWW